MNVDQEWQMFLENEDISFAEQNPINETNEPDTISQEESEEVPVCQELSISTKTKVLYLNSLIKIEDIFWNIPIIPYWQPTDGVLKKQIKIISNTKEEYEQYNQKLKNIPYYVENILKQVDNPNLKKINSKMNES